MATLSTTRCLAVPAAFSLAQTCAPVAWGRGRWPSVDWRSGRLWWVGHEGTVVGWRQVEQVAAGQVCVTGSRGRADDRAWADRVLGLRQTPPPFEDEVLGRLGDRFPGLRPFAHGSLVEGLITSIVGQSISVAAAAITEARLAALFNPPVELDGRLFRPFPRIPQLAEAGPELVRRSGVTWRRAEAIVVAAQAVLDGLLPTLEDAVRAPDAARAALRALPLVGPWTAESALLWGIGLPDAHPTGDVALLRAARGAYGAPDLDLKGLDRLAEAWRPNRAWAARLLWTDLLGTAD